MITIYHNPRCSKSRAGLEFLSNQCSGFKVVDYLKEGLTPADVDHLVKLTGKPITELIRTHEDLYKTEYKGKTLTHEQWCEVIAQNPQLLHRPIVVNNQKAILAQPPESITHIL